MKCCKHQIRALYNITRISLSKVFYMLFFRSSPVLKLPAPVAVAFSSALAAGAVIVHFPLKTTQAAIATMGAAMSPVTLAGGWSSIRSRAWIVPVTTPLTIAVSTTIAASI